MENKTFNFFRFEDLRVYNKSLDYSIWVNSQLNNINDNAITDQFVRRFAKSALNISVFIADGSGRNKNQFIYCLKMAKSYVRECIVYTTIAERNNYFNEENVETSRTYLIEISKMLGALISSLLRKNVKDEPADNEDQSDMNDSIVFSQDEDDF
ncbi:MAG: four helix bundle protein [Bacteroidales bacterium]|nr:four helix bundle protein [Bacteroidales bacterium]